jgi:hypothetical protein
MYKDTPERAIGRLRAQVTREEAELLERHRKWHYADENRPLAKNRLLLDVERARVKLATTRERLEEALNVPSDDKPSAQVTCRDAS